MPTRFLSPRSVCQRLGISARTLARKREAINRLSLREGKVIQLKARGEK
jgi:uncharacterized protein (DUF2384 family)